MTRTAVQNGTSDMIEQSKPNVKYFLELIAIIKTAESSVHDENP